MFYVVFRGRNGIESHTRTQRARIQHEIPVAGLYTLITLGRNLVSTHKTVSGVQSTLGRHPLQISRGRPDGNRVVRREAHEAARGKQTEPRREFAAHL